MDNRTWYGGKDVQQTDSNQDCSVAPAAACCGRKLPALLAFLIVVVAGLGWWWYAAGGATSEQELAAKAELIQLGALVVMDPERRHVHSVNLSTLKSPETLGRAIELLAALPQLQALSLQGSSFQDQQAAALGKLSRLQNLVLSNTAVTDTGLTSLRGLSRLNTIYLVETAVTNAGLPALAQISSLQIVDLSATKVTGSLEPFRELSDLNWLVLRNLTLDAAAFDAIAQFPALTRLTLQESTYPQDAVDKLLQQKSGLSIDR